MSCSLNSPLSSGFWPHCSTKAVPMRRPRTPKLPSLAAESPPPSPWPLSSVTLIVNHPSSSHFLCWAPGTSHILSVFLPPWELLFASHFWIFLFSCAPWLSPQSSFLPYQISDFMQGQGPQRHVHAKNPQTACPVQASPKFQTPVSNHRLGTSMTSAKRPF